MMKSSSRLLAIAAAAIAICGFAVTASAATGLSIQPVKVSYTLKPGESVTDTIILKNAGGNTVVYPSVQDFLPLKGSSNIEFVPKAPGVTSVSDWVKVQIPDTFDFKVGDARNVSFTVTVPKDAEPGSHFGVIFFRAVDAMASTSQLKIGTQVGMLVLVTVPGSHLQKGKIDAFATDGFIQKGPVSFKTTFENTGTVYFEPKGTITIRNMFGKTVATVPVEGSIVLPTGVKDIETTWAANFLLGPYTASIDLYDGEGALMTADSVKFFALPIWYIVGILAILIALYVAIVFFKNRVNFSISLKGKDQGGIE